MHQPVDKATTMRHQRNPAPSSHSLWPYFFSDTIQFASERWPYSRFFAFLDAGDYDEFKILARRGGRGGYLEIQLGGQCDDGYGTFAYRLYAADLDEEEALKVLRAIKAAATDSRGESVKQATLILGRSDLLRRV